MRADAPTRAALVDEWAAGNPRSRVLHDEARRALPGGLAHDVRRADPFPLFVSRAEGARKWDADGHELVDYVLGHGALLLGHGHPAVVGAVQAQATLAFHPGASHELEAAWAAEVTRLVPSAERVRFTSSGTEATMLALQVARAVTGRTRVVKLLGHFHGWHDYAAVGVDPPWEAPASPAIPARVLDSVIAIPADEAALDAALAPGDVAAVILEPAGPAWGGIPLADGFLAAARTLTEASGTLLVFDEVITGFRWAPGGAQELVDVRPDLTALAKVLAGGMPGGAIAGRADVMDALAFRGPDDLKVSHPGTHNAHPLSAAAGVATLRLLADGAVQRRTAERAGELRSRLADVLERRGAPGVVYGTSSSFRLLLGTDRLDLETAKRGTARPLADALTCGMLLGGVHLFHGDGFLSDAHTDADLEQTVNAFDATVARLQDEGLLGS